MSFWAKLFALSLQQRTAQIVICHPSGQQLPLLPEARIMSRSIEKVELRGQIDRAVMDVMDACSMARVIGLPERKQ